MSERTEEAADEILASRRVLLRHPGARLLNELYATPAKSSTQLAEVTNSHGRYRQAANSKTIPGTSNFTLSTSSILNNWELHATLTLAANRIANHGWLFNAVRQVEISFSNALMQSVTLSGLILREFLLYTCESPEQRMELLNQAGRPTPEAGGTFNASIPIGNLLLSAIGQCNQFGIDQSTLSGPIQVTVTINDSGSFTAHTGQGAVALPVAFNSLVMTCDTSEIISSQFSVRTALQYNPGSSYNIPVKYINSINAPIGSLNPAGGVDVTVNLTSCPAGMLEMILLVLKPTSEAFSLGIAGGALAAYNPVGGSVNLSKLRLTYGGQDLFRADTPSEIKANYRSCFGGDVLNYQMKNHLFAGGGPAGPTAVVQLYDGQIIGIPMMFDGKHVARGHLIENLPSYSGATLELGLTIEAGNVRTAYTPAIPWLGVNEPTQPDAVTPFTLQVGYVISGILEISNGTVDLQL